MRTRKWTEENIVKELKKIVEELGYFPIPKEFDSIGYGGLRMAMWQTGKSIQYWQEAAGCETKRNENGHWEDEANIIEEFAEVAKQLDKCPTQKDLRDIGRADIEKAIFRSGKGMAYFQEAIGQEPNERPKGYWKSLENIMLEITKIAKNNKFPTQSVLVSKIGGRIADSIAKFGGANEIAAKMGLEPPSSFIASDGHCLDSSHELVFDEFLYKNKIPHEVHGYIEESVNKCLYDFKIGEIFIEIWGFSERKDNNICEKYNERKKLKEKMYATLNFTLIGIEASVFRLPEQEMHLIFSNLLEEHGIKKQDSN